MKKYRITVKHWSTGDSFYVESRSKLWPFWRDTGAWYISKDVALDYVASYMQHEAVGHVVWVSE